MCTYVYDSQNDDERLCQTTQWEYSKFMDESHVDRLPAGVRLEDKRTHDISDLEGRLKGHGSQVGLSPTQRDPFSIINLAMLVDVLLIRQVAATLGVFHGGILMTWAGTRLAGVPLKLNRYAAVIGGGDPLSVFNGYAWCLRGVLACVAVLHVGMIFCVSRMQGQHQM